jgi:hypothetical protein
MDSKKLQAIVASYARTFVAVVTYAVVNGETDIKAIVIAGLVSVVGPAIRAVNPNDPAFGLIADKVEVELKKASKSKKLNKQ